MNISAPCKGCMDRTTGDRSTDCHAACERYQEFRQAKIEEGRRRRAFYNVRGALQEGRQRREKVSYSSIHGTGKHEKH